MIMENKTGNSWGKGLYKILKWGGAIESEYELFLDSGALPDLFDKHLNSELNDRRQLVKIGREQRWQAEERAWAKAVREDETWLLQGLVENSQPGHTALCRAEEKPLGFIFRVMGCRWETLSRTETWSDLHFKNDNSACYVENGWGKGITGSMKTS